MKKNIIIVFVLFISAAFAVFSIADVIAIVGGKVVVGNGTVYEKATIIIEGNKITEVGPSVQVPNGAKVIDASGKIVWPGMIDPYTTIGLVEVPRVGNDSNETTSTNTAEIHASDGINPVSSLIAVNRLNGITTVLVSPGNRNPINGQAAVINLVGRKVSEMLVADPVALIFNFGATRDGKYPSTRPGTTAFIRQTLYDVQQYGKQKEKPVEKDDEAKEKKNNNTKINLRNEAVLKALKGEIPIIETGGEVVEIANALAVAKEFNLKLILMSARDCWRIIDDIKASGFPMIISSTMTTPGERDPYDRYFKLAATFYEAGIPIAFTTASSHNVRQLPQIAAMAVTFGLPEEEAIKALTLNPAKFLGIDDKVGSLEAGKIANVVVWDGNPLQITSNVTSLIIDGNEIPLVSRQELLRDKYQDLEKVK